MPELSPDEHQNIDWHNRSRAAARMGLGLSPFNKLVKDGDIAWYSRGQGKVKIRKMFKPADIDDCIERRRRIGESPGQPASGHAPLRAVPISVSKAPDIREILASRRKAKSKNSKAKG